MKGAIEVSIDEEGFDYGVAYAKCGVSMEHNGVCGGYWWLWVMVKELGTLEMVLEERRRRKWRFSKATQKAKAETLKCIYSQERKRSSQARCLIEDCNSQIVNICLMNLQTKFQEDPTVNEGKRALLPRWFQTASLRSFI